MDTEDSICRKWYGALVKRWPHVPVTMLSALIFGVLAHGAALFQKFSMVDDPQFLFNVGVTYRSGRWCLGLMGALTRWLFGTPNFSLPLFGGILCLVMLGACACVVIPMLGLERKSEWILTSGLMVIFPVNAGLLGYLFTAPYYLVGLLMALLGCSFLCAKRDLFSLAGGAVLIACSVGIYQAYISTVLCLFLVDFLRRAWSKEQWGWKELLKDAAWYVLCCGAFLAVYMVFNRVALRLSGNDLSSYNSINDPLKGGIPVFWARIQKAYLWFFQPEKTELASADMFPGGLHRLHKICLVLTGIGFGAYIYRQFQRSCARGVAGCLALLVLPLAVNFIHVMVDPAFVHTLMVYSQVFFWLIPYCLIRWCLPLCGKIRLRQWAGRGLCLFLAIVCLFYVRLDNAAYLKLELYQSRTIQYFTTLVTQVKSLDGYRGDMKLAVVNHRENADPTLVEIEELSGFTIEPIRDIRSMVDAYSFREFVNMWCGFDMEVVDGAAFAALPEVEAMPHYPDDGSMCIIDDTVVIKF